MSAETLDIPVSGMHCTGCVTTVQRALSALPEVREVQVDLASGNAAITAEHAPSLAAVAEALTRVGYGIATRGVDIAIGDPGAVARLAAVAGVLSARADPDGRVVRVETLPGASEAALVAAAGTDARILGHAAPQERRDHVVLAVAALLALPFLAEMAVHLAGGHGWMPGWMQFALALPVWAVAGWRFHAGAVRSLINRAPGMDLLVSIGTTAAFGLSLWNLIAGGHLWFEAAALVIVLVRGGKAIEAAARRKAADAAAALLRLAPDRADRVTATGIESVPASALAVDDRVHVAPGAALPADGVVEDGETTIDESMITGEATPVAKRPGDTVIAGSVNGPGTITLRVSATASGSLVARIATQVRTAQSARAPAQALADRVAGWFVPAVLAFAAATFAGGLAVGLEPGTALLRAISVLVVACPCALGIATPIALAAGLGALARAGVLVRDPTSLERLRRIATVAFDKTGTLTEGKPALAGLAGAEDTLKIAASLSVGGRHPLSAGIMRAATEARLAPRPARGLVAVPGRGVTATVMGAEAALGNAALMPQPIPEDLAARAAEGEAEGATPVYLAVGGAVRGVLLLADAPRPGAAESVAALRAEHVRSVMLSGDTQAVAERVASRLGLDEARGGLSPDAKVAAIRSLPGPVAFVGDGINDAPALAAADLGIAMAGGTDAALAAAPVALLRPDPGLVPVAIRLARRTAAAMRQNLWLAFGFNAIALPAAALGLLTPAVAALAMVGSSLAVTLNALRVAAPVGRGGTEAT